MVPAAAVIPGLQVFLLCVAVKTLVVDIGFDTILYETLVVHRCCFKSFVLIFILIRFTLKKLECSKQV